MGEKWCTLKFERLQQQQIFHITIEAACMNSIGIWVYPDARVRKKMTRYHIDSKIIKIHWVTLDTRITLVHWILPESLEMYGKTRKTE